MVLPRLVMTHSLLRHAPAMARRVALVACEAGAAEVFETLGRAYVDMEYTRASRVDDRRRPSLPRLGGAPTKAPPSSVLSARDA